MEGVRGTIQGRTDGGLHQDACGGSGEKWLDSRYNLKVGQAVCSDGLDLMQEGSQGWLQGF